MNEVIAATTTPEGLIFLGFTLLIFTYFLKIPDATFAMLISMLTSSAFVIMATFALLPQIGLGAVVLALMALLTPVTVAVVAARGT